MQNFKPLNKLILVSFIQGSDTTESGIALPEKSRGRPDIGKVEAVADDADPAIKPGQTIQFTEGAGENFPGNAEGLRLIPNESVIAILNAEE